MTEAQIKTWMKLELAGYPELYDTYGDGEVNMTLLAENAAQDLNLYTENGYTIPESVFETAYEVASEVELTL